MTFARPLNVARACGFDGFLGDGFGASHPQSMTVAFALTDAIDAGVMDESVRTSHLPGPAGYARAAMRLGALHRRLSATAQRDGAAGTISVLLVDSRLWSRLTPNARGYDIATHVDGPQPGDVVFVTHEAVLAALAGGTLPVATALDRRLLVVAGESAAATDAARRLLNESFARKESSGVGLNR